MIKSPVVFVLGAGASLPYGYPSGAKLVADMLSLHGDVTDILRNCGYSGGHWGEFQEALKKSAQASIDSFLERRPDMREIGKVLIAAHILRCEYESHFYGNDDHWYPLLLDKLDDPYDALDFSNTTIVTFNYDRSLEQFLFQALCSRHNKDCESVAKTLSRLRIIHVYGYLGPLDWQVTGGRAYSPRVSAAEARIAAGGIKIISEGREDSEEIEQARAAIADAKFVVFLGMGYHPDNMRRLGLPLDNKPRPLSGSGFGLTHNEKEFVRDKYRLEQVGGQGERCREFLRNNPYFLRF